MIRLLRAVLVWFALPDDMTDEERAEWQAFQP